MVNGVTDHRVAPKFWALPGWERLPGNMSLGAELAIYKYKCSRKGRNIMNNDDNEYRKLQKHIDRMPLGFPESDTGLDIKLLKYHFNPEEAEIALNLSMLPEPLERIHKRMKSTISAGELEKKLDGLVNKGAIIGGKIYEKKLKGKFYSKPMLMVGMYELQGTTVTKEYEKDVRDYMDEKFHKEMHSRGTSQLRTIPVNQAVPNERFVETYDNVREVIRNTVDQIAVVKCICRNGTDLLGKPCPHTNIRETCIAISGAADYMIGRGEGRPVTKEETLEILETAEKAGLVLQPENCQAPHFICCCCGCCCHILTSLKLFPRPADYFHSNHYAEVDAEQCAACGTCADLCHMEAINITGDVSGVNRDRCIGCGVCVTACQNDAITLKAKKDKYVPPVDHDTLYKKIFKERYGIIGLLKIIPKALMGLKI